MSSNSKLFNSYISNALTPINNSTNLTLKEVQDSVPVHLKGSIGQGLVDTLNNISNDPIIADDIRKNFLSYGNVLREGKFKIDDYLNAVSYVSYKLMGNTNEEAYAKTFPNRYTTLKANGTSAKDISSYVAAYNKGKLVNLIFEQVLVPIHVLNHDLVQKALFVQADLMVNSASDKVRTDAANSILNHLKKPENNNKLTLNMNTTEVSGISELRDLLGQFSAATHNAIESGKMKTIDAAAVTIIKGDSDD